MHTHTHQLTPAHWTQKQERLYELIQYNVKVKKKNYQNDPSVPAAVEFN